MDNEIVETPTADYTPPVINCEPWQVPGWLNEHGDPTSCVNNRPDPGAPFPEETVPPVVTPEQPEVAPPATETVVEVPVSTGPEELALTGGEYTFPGIIIALTMFVAGYGLIKRSRVENRK